MVKSADFARPSHHSNDSREASTLQDGAKMTLFTPEVESVLSRLYAEASENDHQVGCEEEVAVKASKDGRLDERLLRHPSCRTFAQLAGGEHLRRRPGGGRQQ